MSRGKTRFCWDISQGNRNSAPVRRDRAAARSWHGAAVTEGLSAETMVIISSRLTASQSLLRDLACTPIRRGLPFARARRRGLRSMSGRYSYGIDNPPTLRRSSFPQRVVRPVGVPYCKTRSGTPRDPGRTGTPARKAKRRLPEAWAKRCL